MVLYHKRKGPFMFPMVLLFGFAIWKFTYGSKLEDNKQECVVNKHGHGLSQYLAITNTLGNKRLSEGFRVWDGLRLVIVALPGLFSYCLYSSP